MHWQITDGRPVWLQLKEQIAKGILTGAYPPGSRLPSVRELAIDAGVNPNTMQRALTQLERENLLICNGTLGRFVTKDQTVLENLRQQAVESTVRHCSALLAQLGLTLQDAAAIEKEEV